MLFPRIGLLARIGKLSITDSLMNLVEHLELSGREVFLDQESAQGFGFLDRPCMPRETLSQHIDLAIVLGGDGTLLSIARLLVPHRIPLIGINQGRLGFLTDIPLARMLEDVDDILSGNYVEESRIVLESTVLREEAEINNSLALNDVVLSRGSVGAMIEFEVFINQQFVYSQRSDGLILSTPTGSTAYSLAAGGPILHPSLPVMTLVPICPQSMSNRPIVVGDHVHIELLLTHGLDSRIHFDGQTHCQLVEMDRICIRRYHRALTILHPKNYHYYDMLRQKLHWGERLL